jgi:hypothetical protein
MLELRNVFADNLKSLVRQETSIAHVCRALLINRQQFNRYLSAETIPSKRNIGKIADYFCVTQGALFSPMAEDASAKGAIAAEPLFESFGAVFSGETKFICEGNHLFFVPYPGNVQQCLRGLLIVKYEQSRTRFVIFLNFRKKEVSTSRMNCARYSGLVCEREGKVLFLGNMRGEPGDLFIMNLEPVYSGKRKVFTGLATSARASAISARRCAIEAVTGRLSLLQLARQCAMIDLASPEIDPRIRAAISSDSESGSAILLPREHVAIVGA